MSLAKTRETLRGNILETFTRLRSIIGGNSTVCNYCPLSVCVIDYSPRTTSLFVPRTCIAFFFLFLFFPVSPTDAIISRLLPRYVNISAFVRWSRSKCMPLSLSLSVYWITLSSRFAHDECRMRCLVLFFRTAMEKYKWIYYLWEIISLRENCDDG